MMEEGWEIGRKEGKAVTGGGWDALKILLKKRKGK